MIEKNESYKHKVIQQMKGGLGEFRTEELVAPELLGRAGTLFARGTLAPGHTVGLHRHEKNMEVCYFLRGTGIVRDEQVGKIRLKEGDTHICLPGSAHEIINDGSEELVYLAVVLQP